MVNQDVLKLLQRPQECHISRLHQSVHKDAKLFLCLHSLTSHKAQVIEVFSPLVVSAWTNVHFALL